MPQPSATGQIPQEWGVLPLTVVMPTYNEAASLPRTAGAVMALGLPGLQLKVVDDASPDGTGLYWRTSWPTGTTRQGPPPGRGRG